MMTKQQQIATTISAILVWIASLAFWAGSYYLVWQHQLGFAIGAWIIGLLLQFVFTYIMKIKEHFA
jgi:hypothetical protein